MLRRIMDVYTWIMVAVIIASYLVKTTLAESIGLLVLVLIGLVYQIVSFLRVRIKATQIMGSLLFDFYRK